MPEKLCVSLPPISSWYKTDDRIPEDGDAVIGLVHTDQWTFFAQVVFHGNEFCHEFRLGDKAVYVSHWLYVGVSLDADVIDARSML